MRVKPIRGGRRETSVDVAEHALLEAQEDFERWEHQARQYALELTEAEDSMGEKVVGGVPSGAQVNRANSKDAVEEVADRIASLRVKKEAAERAAEVVHKNEDKAQRAVWLAQADERDERADDKDGEADELQEQIDPLLEQIAELQGVAYVPKPPDRPVMTGLLAPSGVGAPVTHITIPKTQVLRNQALDLRRQAQALRDQAANTPEARVEAAERLRKSRAETLAHTNAEHRRKREEDHAIRKRNRQEREKRRRRTREESSIMRGTPFDTKPELEDA